MNQKEAFLNIESYSEYVKHRDEFKGLKIDREVLKYMAKIFPKDVPEQKKNCLRT